MPRKNDGGPLERLICRQLTDWWTGNSDGDVLFWRTSTSGARATNRGRQGKKINKAHCGDICALGPEGQPLLTLLAFEIKKGYNKFTFMDLLDSGKKSAKQTYEKWVEQAMRSHEQSGSYSWMIVVRRNSRSALAIFPQHLMTLLRRCGAFEESPTPLMILTCEIGKLPMVLCAIKLNEFFAKVRPEHVRKAVKAKM